MRSLLRSRKPKLFGDGPGRPLDRNAKVRIQVYARAWTARQKQPGQHRGPLTRAGFEVLQALLWGFHNAHTGRCFPSYETIAVKADCARDTVHKAIKALERAGILSWVNRLVWVRVREMSPFGRLEWRRRAIRTSNAYVFHDPIVAAVQPNASKSENRAPTINRNSHKSFSTPTIKSRPLDPASILDAAIIKIRERNRIALIAPEEPKTD